MMANPVQSTRLTAASWVDDVLAIAALLDHPQDTAEPALARGGAGW